MIEVKKENNEESGSSNKVLEPEPFRKLFIGGLSLITSDEVLKEFYSRFGELLDCVVMRDSQTKKSRGFGFVTFSSKKEVDKAMKARPHEIDNKTVDPKRAVPRDQSNRSEFNISTKRLYVSGVREDHTEDDFNEHFSSYGVVLKVEIISDKTTGKPRGFAFISFEDYDSVDQCVLQKSHMVKGYRCDVKKALSKEDMSRFQQQDRDRQDRAGRSRGIQRNNVQNSGSRNYNSAWGGPPQVSWSGPPQGQWGPPGPIGYNGSFGVQGGWNAGGSQIWNSGVQGGPSAPANNWVSASWTAPIGQTPINGSQWGPSNNWSQVGASGPNSTARY